MGIRYQWITDGYQVALVPEWVTAEWQWVSGTSGSQQSGNGYQVALVPEWVTAEWQWVSGSIGTSGSQQSGNAMGIR